MFYKMLWIRNFIVMPNITYMILIIDTPPVQNRLLAYLPLRTNGLKMDYIKRRDESRLYGQLNFGKNLFFIYYHKYSSSCRHRYFYSICRYGRLCFNCVVTIRPAGVCSWSYTIYQYLS